MPSFVPDLIGDPPHPVWFRTARFPANTVFPLQRQPWGKLLYALSGVAEFNIEGSLFLSPPAYAIWIPPDHQHESRIRYDVRYVAVYVELSLCSTLPLQPCTLALSNVVKAIVADFDDRNVAHPVTEEDLRMARVVVDRLGLAPRYQSYLPVSLDPLLSPMLDFLQAHPGDRRSLAEWARELATTERTLSRRCRKELGISFNEWRQRLKLVVAIPFLEAGRPVQSIAYDLGYSSPSAFIAMFRHLTGMSPSQMQHRTVSPPCSDDVVSGLRQGR